MLFITIVFTNLIVYCVGQLCEPCNCTLTNHGELVANCTNLLLDKIPENIPNSTYNLIMKNNTLLQIQNNTFVRFKNLTLLDLTVNNISRVEFDSFAPLNQLDTLDISQNIHFGFEMLGKAIHGFQYSALRVLKANKIVVSHAVCICISVQMLKHFNETSIEEIYINDNRIEIFQVGALGYLPSSLWKVSAKNNRFTTGAYLYKDLVKLRGLRELILSGHLKEPNIPLDIPEVDNFPLLERSSCLGENYKYDNYYEPEQSHHNHIVPFSLSPNLTTLQLNYCNLDFVISQIRLNNNSLEEISIASNALGRWIGPVTGVHQLKYLDLSHNFCSYIQMYFFNNFTSLQTLNISYNILERIIAGDTNGTIFRELKSLKELKIRKNSLSYLPPRIFDSLVNLETLDLSLNELHSQMFNIHLSHMKNLTYIDFSYNHFQFLNRFERKQLEIAGNMSGKLTVNFINNPFYCTCDNEEFLQWMFTNCCVRFINIDQYLCLFVNGSTSYLNQSNEIFEQFASQCHQQVSLVISCFGSFVIIMGFISGAVLYRFRWKLRYLYYAAKNSQKMISDIDFEYDGFISYSDDARFFVESTMRSTVEEETGIKLCLHNRDFLASRPIGEGIVTAIKTSRKTVLVMSPDFLDSYWCQYEMNMADMESQHTGRDLLLILFYKYVQYDEIPKTVMYQIKTHTYIAYPSSMGTENSDEMNMFWENFKTALLSP